MGDLAAWDPLIGAWASTGRTVDAVEVEGTDVYEWLPGRRFVVHHVDVRVGGEQVDVLEVIGERDGDAFLARSFDGWGGTSVMRASVDEAGEWTFAGPAERATLAVAPDGTTMSARWERLRDGSWEHWMDMEFRRVD
ncbi:hypothetical protein [Pseudonocardia zijingensis]|jgi:hypothetical protein|uniref:DUF1579 domain-containing protein n=1 Tax=Pseudonocardia zijingensis TaxID=153376 RepID=A0ABP4A7H2_9PSEU